MSDLPTGWAVDNSSTTNSGNGCNSQPLNVANPTKYAHRYFDQNGTLPELEEAIGTFSNVQAAFVTIKAAQDNCTSFTSTASGQTVHGTQGAMSYPSTGDESAAWTASFTVQGVQAVFDIVIVRKGSQVVGIALGDIGSVDTTQLQQFVATALGKIT